MAHAFVTVVVPFDDSRSVAVNAHLDALGNLARPPLSETLNASAFVHFMSLTVVRDSSGGSAYLVLEASADGYPGGVLNRLAREIGPELDRKSTRLNSSHSQISYAVFCLKQKKT